MPCSSNVASFLPPNSKLSTIQAKLGSRFFNRFQYFVFGMFYSLDAELFMMAIVFDSVSNTKTPMANFSKRVLNNRS